jgi:hypothetical protein
LQSGGAEEKSQRPSEHTAAADKQVGVLSASNPGEQKEAVEELGTSTIKAMAHSKSDDADAQVHGDDAITSDIEAKLLPSLNRCLPFGMPFPSRCVLFDVYFLSDLDFQLTVVAAVVPFSSFESPVIWNVTPGTLRFQTFGNW